MSNFIFGWGMFVFGVLGAALPEVYRLYKARKFDIKVSAWGALITMSFFLSGGIVAVVLQSPTPYAAFYNGVTAPFIISKMTEGRFETDRTQPSISPRGFGAPPAPGEVRRGRTLSNRQYVRLLFASGREIASRDIPPHSGNENIAREALTPDG